MLQEAAVGEGGTLFYWAERKMRPAQLLFTQDSIRPNFRDGRPIYQLLNDLSSGAVDPLRDLEPLDVVWSEGKWWCLCNRRLWALRVHAAAADQEVWVRVRPRPADRGFREKSTTRNGGSAR